MLVIMLQLKSQQKCIIILFGSLLGCWTQFQCVDVHTCPKGILRHPAGYSQSDDIYQETAADSTG